MHNANFGIFHLEFFKPFFLNPFFTGFHDNFLSSNTDLKETPNNLISRTNKVREKSVDILSQIDDELNSQTSDARKSTLLLHRGTKLLQHRLLK